MKYRIVSIVFILIFALYMKFFNLINVKEIERFLSNHIISIDVIMEDNSNEIDGIRNGNYIIKSVDDFTDIFKYDYIGVSISLLKYKINLIEMFGKYDIVIDNTYIINDNKVYDCHVARVTGNYMTTMQVVEYQDNILVGVPCLLNGF